MLFKDKHIFCVG